MTKKKNAIPRIPRRVPDPAAPHMRTLTATQESLARVALEALQTEEQAARERFAERVKPIVDELKVPSNSHVAFGPGPDGKIAAQVSPRGGQLLPIPEGATPPTPDTPAAPAKPRALTRSERRAAARAAARKLAAPPAPAAPKKGAK